MPLLNALANLIMQSNVSLKKIHYSPKYSDFNTDDNNLIQVEQKQKIATRKKENAPLFAQTVLL